MSTGRNGDYECPCGHVAVKAREPWDLSGYGKAKLDDASQRTWMDGNGAGSGATVRLMANLAREKVPEPTRTELAWRALPARYRTIVDPDEI